LLSLNPFASQEGEGEVEALDLTAPSLIDGTASAGRQVLLEFVQPRQQQRMRACDVHLIDDSGQGRIGRQGGFLSPRTDPFPYGLVRARAQARYAS
jgi:hypothetical protein